jgi:ankyrin repeat protein
MKNKKQLIVSLFVLLVGTVCVLGKGTDILKAARACDVVKMKTLLAEDPKCIEVKDQMDNSVLHMAAYSGCVEGLEILIAAGADMNALNKMGVPPLWFAVMGNHSDAARLLILKGTDVAIKGPNGMTPLHLCTIRGNLDLAKLLVQKGAAVDQQDTSGRTPLLWTLFNSRRQVAEMAKLFIHNGADVNVMDKHGRTPLKCAVEKGYLELVKLLISKGADINQEEIATGRSLLHIAAIRGFRDITELLIKKGLPVNKKDNFGYTAAMYSVEHGHGKVAELFHKSNVASREMTLSNDAKAIVWYLDHRGWAVKTANHLLIFDSEDFGRDADQPSLDNGHLVANQIADMNVFAIYSSYHGLPGEPGEPIHRMGKKLKNITYVHNKGDRWKWDYHTIYIGPGEMKKSGALEIFSIPMSHYTLGYLLKIDGVTIFYSGYTGDKLEEFKKQIDLMVKDYKGAGDIDIAFLQVNEESSENPWADYAIEKLRPATVIPTGPNRRPELYKKMAEKLKSQKSRINVLCARDAGDRFTVK